MTSPRKRFPQSLMQFLMATEGMTAELPPEVTRLAGAILKSLHSNKQRKAINLRFSRLRKSDSKFFDVVIAWLESKSGEILFQKIGGYWAISYLIKAFKNIQSNQLPSLALGMHKNGAPPIWGFTKLECAAIYAENLVVNHSVIPDLSISLAAIDYSLPTSAIRSTKQPDLSKEDLAVWAYHETIINKF